MKKITWYLLLSFLVTATAIGGWYYSRFQGDRPASRETGPLARRLLMPGIPLV